MKHRGAPLRARKFVICIVFLVFGMLLTACSNQPVSGEQEAPVSADQETAEPSSELPHQIDGLPSFTLLKDNSFEDAGTAKVIWEILVASDVTKESLTSLLNDLYSQAQSKGFAQHDEATVIDIKAYVSKEHAESGQGQWIGWISKSGDASQPSMTFDDRQIDELGNEDEEKFGMSEEKRKEIWQEIIRVEDRANHDDQLIEQSRNELANQYGIARGQLDEIADEGLKKSWPFPQN